MKFPADEVAAQELSEVQKERETNWTPLAIEHGGQNVTLIRGLVTRADIEASCGDLAAVVKATDLAPNVYEGGLKLWECAIDLCHHLAENHGSLSEKRHQSEHVLELGCGHGLPGILALRSGASVDFADYNAEVEFDTRPTTPELNPNHSSCLNMSTPDLFILQVLRHLTFPNVAANCPKVLSSTNRFHQTHSNASKEQT